jgi:hypothetical protein
MTTSQRHRHPWAPALHLLAQRSLSLRHHCHIFGTCRSAGTLAMHLDGAILDKFRPHLARNSILFASQLIRSDGTLKSWAEFCFAHNRRRCRPGIWFARLQQVVLEHPQLLSEGLPFTLGPYFRSRTSQLIRFPNSNPATSHVSLLVGSYRCNDGSFVMDAVHMVEGPPEEGVVMACSGCAPVTTKLPFSFGSCRTFVQLDAESLIPPTSPVIYSDIPSKIRRARFTMVPTIA